MVKDFVSTRHLCVYKNKTKPSLLQVVLNVTIIYCRESREFPSGKTFYGWQDSSWRDLK